MDKEDFVEQDSLEKKSKFKIRPPTKKQLLKSARGLVPITNWIVNYSKEDAIGDLIAGITVGLTVIPQSLGYAAIAGLSPEYGLYSSYIGPILYVFLGTCRQASLGPTAIMGLLTYQTCGDNYPSCVILTAFYAGVFELLMAILQLGWIVSFISEPTTTGFTSGAAVVVLSGQVASLLGLSGEKGDEFISYWKAIFKNIKTAKAGDCVLGLSSIIILLLLRKLKEVKVKNKYMKTSFWLISLSRNVIVIVISSLIAYIWNAPPFKLMGDVDGGFPVGAAPEFLLSHRPYEVNCTWITPNEKYSFMEAWSKELKTGPVVIALISILQVVSIGKAFGSGQSIDATQEMFALGTINFVGSFFSAIPSSAAFSRSAVNEASGVRTPLGGLYTGILVILALNFLSSSFYWIPKSSLAAVIIAAVIFMVDYETLLPMWRISKIDAITNVVTFLASLGLGMEYGILVGVVFSLGALLFKNLKPEISFKIKTDPVTGTDYLFIIPSNGLSFPSNDHIANFIQKTSLKHKECNIIIIDFAKWSSSDYTGASNLINIEKGMKKAQIHVGFLHCGRNWVKNFKIGGLAEPPVIENTESITLFIQKKLKSALNDKEVELNQMHTPSIIVEPSNGNINSDKDLTHDADIL